MKKSLYRPEIDGLRALAVVAVVLFHLGLGLPGGFIGVDVFFVISGFLITGIIRRGLEDETFSLAEFWERRVRRIFPAMFVVVLATLATGYWLLPPNELEDLGKSAVAQCLFLANVYFWRDTGYFAGPAELKPLLHTWSLAVEEQFYLFFPLLLVFFRKLSSKRLFWILAMISFLSLSNSVYGTLYQPGAAFFLLPMRAWELLAGCMLAVFPWKCKPSLRRDGVIAVAGLLAIILPVFFYNSQTLFPGLAALPPVLGTAAVIFATANTPTTTVGRVLSLRPVVFVGLISYSLYLWHWPVIVYSRTYWGDLGWKQIIFALFCSIVLAVLSWNFVEKPFRRHTHLKQRRRLFATAFVLTTVCVLIGIAVTVNILFIKTHGLSSRFSNFSKVLYEDTTWEGLEFALQTSPMKPIQISDFPTLGRKPGKSKEVIDFVVWGDSHGMFLSNCINDTAKQSGLSGKAIFCPGCPPLPNVYRTDIFSATEQLHANREIMKQLDRIRPRNLILIARWSMYTNGLLKQNEKSQDVQKIISDDASFLPNSESPSSIIERNLRLLIDFCAKKNITLWIVKQVPETGELTPARQWLLFKSGRIHEAGNHRRTLDEHQRQQANINEVFQSVGYDSVRFVNPASLLFDSAQQTINYRGGRALYRDDDHLTRWGAEAISPLLRDMFHEMSKPSPEATQSSEVP